MTSFKKGDIVRFKGDDADYKVVYVNDADRDDVPSTYELEPVPLSAEDPFVLDFIPGRLLELAPQPLKNGDVVKDEFGNIYVYRDGFFIEKVHEFVYGVVVPTRRKVEGKHTVIGQLVLN